MGYILKLDPTGAFPVYSTFLASYADANPMVVTLDASGDAYVASQSGGGDPGHLVNPIELFTNQSDVFLQEIDPTGGSVLFSTWLGGYGYDYPSGVALDASGTIYVTGYTNSTDYPATAAALQNTLGGNSDVFVSKIGTAVQPAVTLSPSLVQFSIRPVGSVSQPNTSLLRNMGSGPLTITNLTTTGDFTETDNCGSGVGPAATCTFTVTFTPTQPGPRYGSIMIEDDAAGSPHFINLVGNGATAVASISPTSLSFPSLQINQSSEAQTVTITNNGNATMVITQISVSGDYAQTNTCPGSLGIGSSCTVQITFTPDGWRRARWNVDHQRQRSWQSTYRGTDRQRIRYNCNRKSFVTHVRESGTGLDQFGSVHCDDQHRCKSDHCVSGGLDRRLHPDEQLHGRASACLRFVHD